tara:strand:+ start:1767 stop:2156 length:390 start_codon:yes stop_codon:yes gene_type:complete
MGIEDDFYSTIKFKSGEEIFCKVAASEEGDRTMLIISNPIIVEELTSRGKVTGYKFEPWLKFTTDDMFVVDMDNVLTMSESTDIDIILFYQDFIRKMNKSNYSKLSKEMGYITSVDEAKVSLENIFNNS